MITILKIVGYLAFIPAIWQLGNYFCRLFVWLSKSTSETEQQPQIGIKAGRYIGFLERALIVIGLLTNNWEVLVAVIAIKTVARYTKLDDQVTAEYFMIGSLASILWAALMAGGLTVYDRTVGYSLIEAFL